MMKENELRGNSGKWRMKIIRNKKNCVHLKEGIDKKIQKVNAAQEKI